MNPFAGGRSPLSVLGIAMALLAVAWGNGAAGQDSIRADQIARIDKAIAAGAGFLAQQQDPDGTWRSRTYGLLKDGTALTPLVLVALPIHDNEPSRQRGMNVLSSWVDNEARPARIRLVPQSPVYVAGLVMKIQAETGNATCIAAALIWRELLISHQLNEQNGWSPDEARFGGWGYSHEPPIKPAEGAALSPLDEPNLSATVMALDGLTAIPLEDRLAKSRLWNALQFVERCQNWREGGAVGDRKYNDGGFHFMLADEVRNKAGVAGVDATGQTRFHSYGSATADGMRAMMHCGLPADHPRVAAARDWLITHFEDGAHPGTYPADRSAMKPSLDFYYAASVAQSFRFNPPENSRLARGQWAVILADRLQSQQRQNGSWSNPAVDVREDDPLIATSFALRSLQFCREALRTAVSH